MRSLTYRAVGDSFHFIVLVSPHLLTSPTHRVMINASSLGPVVSHVGVGASEARPAPKVWSVSVILVSRIVVDLALVHLMIKKSN